MHVIALSIKSFPSSLWTPSGSSVKILYAKSKPADVPTSIISYEIAIQVSVMFGEPKFLPILGIN